MSLLLGDIRLIWTCMAELQIHLSHPFCFCPIISNHWPNNRCAKTFDHPHTWSHNLFALLLLLAYMPWLVNTYFFKRNWNIVASGCRGLLGLLLLSGCVSRFMRPCVSPNLTHSIWHIQMQCTVSVSFFQSLSLHKDPTTLPQSYLCIVFDPQKVSVVLFLEP